MAANKTEANKSEPCPISFNVLEDGDYIIYTDSQSSGSAYYSKIVLESPVNHDFNNDGVVDIKDAADMLKHYSGIKIVSDNELLVRGDINSDGIVDLTDVIAFFAEL